MNTNILSGEASSTLVAAVYPDRTAASLAAGRVAGSVQLASWQLAVIQPGDPRLASKAEPEREGIWRTVLRSHLWLGLAGLLAGLLVAALMIGMDWLGARDAPGTLVAALAAFSAMGGLMLAGAFSLRPDHAYVLTRVREALARGQWAVVARPASPAQTRATLSALEGCGGRVLRSI